MDLYNDAVAMLEQGRREEAIQWLSRLSVDFADTEGGRRAAEKLAALTAAEGKGKSLTPPPLSGGLPNGATPIDASGNASEDAAAESPLQHPVQSPHDGPAAEPEPRK